MSYLVAKGEVTTHWNVSGNRIIKFSMKIYHSGLDEQKLITAPDLDLLYNKVDMQVRKWEERWTKLESERMLKEEKEASLEEANQRTTDAERAIRRIENLLSDTLSVDDSVDWEQLKNKAPFHEKKPTEPGPAERIPDSPKPVKVEPVFSFFERLFKSLREKKSKQYEDDYQQAVREWEQKKRETDQENQQLANQHKKKMDQWKKEVREWEKRKQEFEQKQKESNKKVDELRQAYKKLEPDAIVEYCGLVLENSNYPDDFYKDYELEFNPETKILVVEYQLPSMEQFPRLKEVKYVASKKEMKESYLSEAQVQRMFDDALYKLTLRTLHELFEADQIQAIAAISFNGWMKAINKATGKEETNCIMTVQVKKSEFMAIDLANVDPKLCFKNIKGVAGSKLSALTPVQPILQISKQDKRFVDSYNVADQLDHTTNLAAMDWEDFEHLIREVFEKEFQSNGGEVKVTKASRDGGIDAVAFDPDPIRGGKIVIQAKRYTNIVTVGAVRELYGAVINEGANKGILVSTADYGPDAYEFAKDKPLILLNGGNLLHLLEKHGHHAKIDLREAKRILAEKEKEKK